MREYKLLGLIPAEQIGATADGTGVDVTNYIHTNSREYKAALSVGAVAGTDPTMDVTIEESDSLSTGYTAITGAAFTQATAATSEEIHFQSIKKYIRAAMVVTGTDTPLFDIAVLLLVKEKINS